MIARRPVPFSIQSAQHLIELTERSEEQARRIENLTQLIAQLQRENFALKSERWKELLDEFRASAEVEARKFAGINGETNGEVEVDGGGTSGSAEPRRPS